MNEDNDDVVLLSTMRYLKTAEDQVLNLYRGLPPEVEHELESDIVEILDTIRIAKRAFRQDCKSRGPE